MSDGGKSPIGGTFEDIEEAVKPAADEVGKAIEQGVQSVIFGPGGPKPAAPTPGQPQEPTQNPTDNANKLSDARRKIKYWQDLDTAQRRVREESKQKDFQKVQGEQQEKQVKQFEVMKKKENQALKNSKTKTEIRGGVGG